ncbi:MAG: NERD domain-containing protein [Proteobacteria bacterium]|nr:NERD domain-containing protein [Pseudomonadota bacterium]
MNESTLTTFAGAVLAIILLVVALWLFVRWRRNANNDFKRLIRLVSIDRLENVVIPDGVGGEIHLDHLLLTPHGLLLLETRDTQGAIFAGDRLDIWTATSDTARVTFDNPIPILQERAAAIGFLVTGVPIEARVLFVNQVTFPKGHPAEVSTISALMDEYASIRPGTRPRDFSEQWRTLVERSRPFL